jgi:hypothetical protein
MGPKNQPSTTGAIRVAVFHPLVDHLRGHVPRHVSSVAHCDDVVVGLGPALKLMLCLLDRLECRLVLCFVLLLRGIGVLWESGYRLFPGVDASRKVS